MALFRKKPAEPAPGRRRPASAVDGGRRAETFSYYSRRSSSQSNTGRLDAAAIEAAQPDKAHAGMDVRTRWLMYVGIGAAVLLFVALTSLSGQPRVDTMATGNSRYFLQDPSVYQQAVTSALNDSLLNRNKLTIDTAKIQSTITRAYPEIKAVSVHVPFIGSSPTVSLVPYQATFILTTTGGASYLLDETGRAVLPISQLPQSQSVQLPVLHDESGRSVRSGSAAIAKTTVSFASQVLAVLHAQKISVSSLSLPANSSELDVSPSGRPYIVKFNLQGDPHVQAGTYVAAARRLQKDKTVPAAYIDVRVPERAYYK